MRLSETRQVAWPCKCATVPCLVVLCLRFGCWGHFWRFSFCWPSLFALKAGSGSVPRRSEDQIVTDHTLHVRYLLFRSVLWRRKDQLCLCSVARYAARTVRSRVKACGVDRGTRWRQHRSQRKRCKENSLIGVDHCRITALGALSASSLMWGSVLCMMITHRPNS